MKIKYRDPQERHAMVLSFIIYLTTLISLAFLAQANLFNVFIGTLTIPAYLALIFFFPEKKPWMLWVFPVALNFIFLFIWQLPAFNVLRQIDGPILVVFNILICYLMNIFFTIFTIPHVTKVHKTRDVEPEYKPPQEITINYTEQKDELKSSLRSIEEKCKAINFVIGRVYSNKRGANGTERAKIKIRRELYNNFSDIVKYFTPDKKEAITSLINQIKAQLEVFNSKSHEVIKLRSNPLMPIDMDANDTVLQTLAKNDKDPIEDYHKETMQICERLTKNLEENNTIEN